MLSVLDASKAFDRVLHMKVFEKLIQRNMPMCFVRLLKHWYKEQTMQIKWDLRYGLHQNVLCRLKSAYAAVIATETITLAMFIESKQTLVKTFHKFFSFYLA